MSNFDPSLFMQETIDVPLDTEFKQVPPGEYKAMVGDFTSEAFKQYEFEYKRGPRQGQPGTMTKFGCPFVLDAPQVAADLNREKVLAYKDYILDIDDGGRIETGINKNVELGQLRAAAGQKDRTPWSIGMLANSGPLMVRVVHESIKDKEGKDTGKKRAVVDKVAPII
jgi:hypothetical protein